MFPTFRIRLLFWFLVFISSSLVIIVLSMAYLKKREAIFARSEAIDHAYLSLLKSVQKQQGFFSYETKNGEYFLTGKSPYLEEYHLWLDSTFHALQSVDFSREPEIQKVVYDQQTSLNKTDSIFIILTRKINQRGFKDYNLEGSMRDDAHWLEQVSEIPNELILSLRRHEKDYIIRNDPQYIAKFELVIEQIREMVQGSNSIPSIRKDTIVSVLKDYDQKFLELVELDKVIGIKDNSGLKLELDTRIREVEYGFSELVGMTRIWARKEFDLLTLYFGLTVLSLVVISIVISAFIAHRITKPLTDLTLHITGFVDSNFTDERESPVVRSRDEIGKLTKNFSILKNEVISQMKFFKQRVEERTAELAFANKKLARIIEANSRFVPTEFLQNLGRSSIEEVELGDQVERDMTVVFTDIRGFTKLSEELNPQETFDFLNQYLGGIVPIILDEGGFIDKFIGDSVMALFPNSPSNAIRAAQRFDPFIKTFNQKLKLKYSMDPVEIGTGIHTGSMILGTIGHDDRLETTVISDAVNTAARVEGLTKFYGTSVIITEDSLLRIENSEEMPHRFLDKVKVKGKSKSLSVYEVIPPADTLKIKYQDSYAKAVKLFKKKKIKEALKAFREILEINHKDQAVERFIKKCEEFDEGKIGAWDGVTKMTMK